MKRFIFLSVFALLSVFATVSDAQQVPKKNPAGVGYLEYLPSVYSYDTTEVFPCIVFLHGSGERGTGSATDLAKITNNAIPKLIKNGHKMAFNVGGKTQYFIVLSPQTNKWKWESKETNAFVRWAKKNYRIDSTRVYVTGLSMGGEGTWLAVGEAAYNTPNQYAAAVVVCGRGSAANGNYAAKSAIDVWAFHGSADKDITPAGGLNPINGMRSFYGDANYSKWPGYTSYAFEGHAIWEKAYSPTASPNIYTWLLSKSRK